MSVRRSRPIRSMIALGLLAALAVAAPAGAHPGGTVSGTGHSGFPATVGLPDGFQPEGIAIGALPLAYFGSLADGSIYRANLVTGGGRVISQGPGTPSVGLELDHRGRLFVAGGPAGNARVVSVLTGRVLASYSLAAGPSFVNDVTVTSGAAWFTDSLNPVLYRVPLDRGALPDPSQVTAVPLTGEFVQQPGFNANGISGTPDRAGLLVIQSNTGLLFRVDPETGVARQVDLGGDTLPNGDGILLRGRTLYVVQNQLNQVAVVALNRTGTRGTVVTRVGDPRFDVPTTVASFGNRLYLPNARFGTPPGPDTQYQAVAIPRPKD